MALNFPAQPQEVGTPYEAPNGVTYTWDGVKWVAAGTPGGGSANLGNLYIIDQTISGLNETQPITITGNVNLLGNIDAFSYHSQIGTAGGGFRFLNEYGDDVSGLFHTMNSNVVILEHTGHKGVSLYSNGSVEINTIVNPTLYLKGNIEAASMQALRGSDKGYRFVDPGHALAPTAIIHNDSTNEIQITHENFVGFAQSNSHVKISNLLLDGTSVSTENGTLYVDGVAVGGAGFASELAAGDYTLTLYPNGNTVIPGTISSTATGIPEFNSSTDLNLNAANRVNIVQSPLNLASVPTGYVLGKPGDILFDPDDKQIKTYANGAWETLLRTAENQNVRLPQGGTYQRADGVRAAWYTDLPTDISQLTDNNNLLAGQSITLQNIDIDGGGAYSIYETGLLFADGGFGSTRFGPSDTVFDGAGAGSGYTNSLNGGGA
jgi:hypothetical protein